MLRISIILFAVLTLAACQRGNVRPTNTGVYQNLSDVTDWSLQGKIAFSDGKDGGSGKFQWRFIEGDITADLKAPLGQGSWRLHESPNGEARLYSGKDDYVEDYNAEILVSRQIGWRVPWGALKSWLRVQPHQPSEARTEKVGDKLIIYEQGWRIEYKKWTHASGRLLPARITARKEPYSIKLSIRDWGL